MPVAMVATDLPDIWADDAARLAAVRARDPRADGQFFYSVLTTGVFCYPSCAARPALRQHMSFHASAAEAERAGFRPCRRCRPDLPPRTEREAAIIAAACRFIEEAEEPPPLADLARHAGLSPYHFHRLFRRLTGVTPKAYAGAWRQTRVQSHLAAGTRVTEAIYDAGFNSSGRFYAAAPAMLGMTPSRYRAGGNGETIRYAMGESSLGTVAVAATELGICAIFLGDDSASLTADLAARFPQAALQPAEPTFEDWIRQVVAMIDHPEENAALALPLDIRGTAFQRRVWAALRQIPPGETRSYREVAASLGAPSAVRAVAGACAANALAVAIPCHRVIAANGDLAGYRWGSERKRRLLDKEGA
ncbi:MAG TPA: bifunctional DNA-binding transcriptional regulator/O6-methylguanine-DNA methyltransferase Ada [Acidisoma sp.]|uniref:bifunctional DNA-binding transcriptional regulator/O6-methylguanine-DNA methyltransferase Ada n=1 Tax=Acidisoma sp. TaxID=1872115 RepID=UPI002CA0B2FC|nr:bifunctional DNA-binding transcriptional regulator/O6-methylguanine-DNA methyltransferase Ada [Acidisoma sp.]HTI02617.1 bifunctional DNA-binding transcriptional regulator/O6-methylguanine-DNA methyltransferase Ada [Acidisoma sp.]